MAAQQNASIPFPAAFSPIPEDYDTTVQQLQQQQQQQQQQHQRPPSKPAGGTTFAERLNGFFAGIIRTDDPPARSNSSGLDQQLSGAQHCAAPLDEGLSNGQITFLLADAERSGAVDLSAAAFATDNARQHSIESEASLQRVLSGASASTSGDADPVSQQSLRHSFQQRAKAEAIGVYGERYGALH